MDIEKLVEDGARAICVEMGNNPDVDAGMTSGEGCAMWECFTHESRAVLAIALRAAAEEAADHAAADMAYAIKYPDETQRMGERAHRARAISNRLRALAAQLGGSDDARCR